MQPQDPYRQPGYQPTPGPVVQPHDYEFIVNPKSTPKSGISLPGGNSVLKRVLIVGAGLIMLIVIFSIVKGLLSGGGNQAALLSVTQQQQAIIHTTTAAKDVTSLSINNRNLIVNSLLSVTSAQNQMFKYIHQTGGKIDTKLVGAKISALTDSKLTDAAAASTYNETIDQVLNDQLTAYQVQLKAAYAKTKGKQGRALLNAEYEGASLLLTELKAVNN